MKHNTDIRPACKSPRLIAAALTLAASACGTTHSQELPLAGSQAPQAIDPLLMCATKMNLQAKQEGSDVVVPLDGKSRLTFKTNEKKALTMDAHVDGAEGDAETQRRLAAAKATGDALFRCAQATPTPASKAPGTPTPTLGNTTSAP